MTNDSALVTGQRGGRKPTPALHPSPLPRCGIHVSEVQLSTEIAWTFGKDQFYLGLVLAGGGSVEGDRSRTSLEFESGSLVHLAGPHSLRLVPPRIGEGRSFWIRYRPTLISPDVRRLVICSATLVSDLKRLGESQVESFRGEFQEMLYEQTRRQEGWRLALTSGLGRILVRLLRLQRPLGGAIPRTNDPFGRMANASGRVASHLHELETQFTRRIHLDDAARASQLSRRRFTQIFRELTGSSWRRYLEQIRLRHAEQMLLQTKQSVINIALEVGFEDISSFNRAFKLRHAMSPLQFRSRYR